MSLGSFLKSKRYLSTIFLLIAISFFVIFVSFSVIYYVNLEKKILINEYTNNQKILYRIRQNVSFVNDLIKTSCLYIYFQEDTQWLLKVDSSQTPASPHYTAFRNLKKLPILSNLFHSIFVFNPIANDIYSTDYGIIDENGIFANLIMDYKDRAPLSPIVRVGTAGILPGFDGEYVLSYILQSWLDREGGVRGGAIFNIKLGWLLNDMYYIPTIGHPKNEKIIIMTETGEVIHDDPRNEISSLLRRHLTESFKGYSEPEGFFTHSIAGEKYLFTYTFVPETGWRLFLYQPYQSAILITKELRFLTVVITSAFVLLAIVFSLLLSFFLYRPISGLMKTFAPKGHVATSAGMENEFDVLRNTYSQLIRRVEHLKSETDSNRDIVKMYYLRSIILDSYAIGDENGIQIEDIDVLGIDIRKPLALGLLQLDEEKVLEEEYRECGIELLKYSLMQYLHEAFDRNRICLETVSMSINRVAFLLNPSGNEIMQYCAELTPILQSVQQQMISDHQVFFSVALSDVVPDVREVTPAYHDVINSLQYRRVFGKSSIITPITLKKNQEKQNGEQLETMEKKLIRSLKAGCIPEAVEGIDEFFTVLSQMNYFEIRSTIMHLAFSITSLAEEMNYTRISPMHFDYRDIVARVFGQETLEEIRKTFQDMLAHFNEVLSGTSSNKNRILVETVIEIIHNNYIDTGLCLKQIASMLKLSTSHAGKVFREDTGQSVSRYITTVRMQKACELMINTDLNISAIITRVGFDNATYFYQLFKKTYGMTPKEYIITQALQK